MVVGCWLLVVGCWLLVVGLLVGKSKALKPTVSAFRFRFSAIKGEKRRFTVYAIKSLAWGVVESRVPFSVFRFRFSAGKVDVKGLAWGGKIVLWLFGAFVFWLIVKIYFKGLACGFGKFGRRSALLQKSCRAGDGPPTAGYGSLWEAALPADFRPGSGRGRPSHRNSIGPRRALLQGVIQVV